MEATGYIRNGVVVFDTPTALPEGTPVTVSVRSLPAVYVSPNPTDVEFPLIRTSEPGSVPLTNERIGELLDEEELDSIKR
jgi:hypothetical protein